MPRPRPRAEDGRKAGNVAPRGSSGRVAVSLLIIVVLVAIVVALLAASIRIVKHYERGVIFRLGRLREGARGPA